MEKIALDSSLNELSTDALTVQNGQVETEETENRNGKLKRKTEAESGN